MTSGVYKRTEEHKKKLSIASTNRYKKFPKLKNQIKRKMKRISKKRVYFDKHAWG